MDGVPSLCRTNHEIAPDRNGSDGLDQIATRELGDVDFPMTCARSSPLSATVADRYSND